MIRNLALKKHSRTIRHGNHGNYGSDVFLFLITGNHCLNRMAGIYRMDRISQPWFFFILIILLILTIMVRMFFIRIALIQYKYHTLRLRGAGDGQ